MVYPDAPQQRPASPLLAAVLTDLAAARASVDLASFDFDIPAIIDALLRAADRGVLVRLVVDSENLDTPAVSEQTGRLQRAGIAVHFDRREPFMHNKIIVVDGAVAWMGSWNVTDNEFQNNNNFLRCDIVRSSFPDLLNIADALRLNDARPFRKAHDVVWRVGCIKQAVSSVGDGLPKYRLTA